MDDDPLILTLALDALTQQRFERERRQHFPAARNHIPAHVSMFQSLPGAELVAIVGRLEALRGRARLAVEVCGVRTLGRGCAYELRSAALDGLRAELARLQAGFMPWTAQGVGVTLWRYLGGPWERLDHVEFAREPDGPAWGPPGA